MRILHVFKTYIPDSFAGIERVIWQIAEGCADFGIESEVLSLSKRPGENSMTVGRHYAAKAKLLTSVASTGLSFDFIGALRKRAQHADVIHYHYPWPMMDVAHFLTLPRRPTLLTYHSDIVRQKRLANLYAPMQHAFLSQMDAIVATSPNYAQTSATLARHKNKLAVVPIGLAPVPPNEPDDARVAFWMQRLPERFFLFVGALRYYKGIQYLIQAAKLTDLPIVVVGEGEMSDDVQTANLPNMHLVGTVSDDDKAAILSLCTAFIFPSHLRSEAFGVALLEAAFAGKPMISCEIGTGTSYINLDKQTGFVVKPGDGSALASAMETFWAEPELCRKFGCAALNRANTLFRADKMAQDYADLYRRLTTQANQFKLS